MNQSINQRSYPSGLFKLINHPHHHITSDFKTKPLHTINRILITARPGIERRRLVGCVRKEEKVNSYKNQNHKPSKKLSSCLAFSPSLSWSPLLPPPPPNTSTMVSDTLLDTPVSDTDPTDMLPSHLWDTAHTVMLFHLSVTDTTTDTLRSKLVNL